MSLNVKNPVVVELTRELATQLGTTQVSALEIALRAKLEDLRAAGRAAADPGRARALLEAVWRAGGDHPRSRAEIDEELYDEAGLPR